MSLTFTKIQNESQNNSSLPSFLSNKKLFFSFRSEMFGTTALPGKI